MGLTVIIIVAIAVAFPLAMISFAEMYKRLVSYKERQMELMADRESVDAVLARCASQALDLSGASLEE